MKRLILTIIFSYRNIHMIEEWHIGVMENCVTLWRNNASRRYTMQEEGQ